MVTAIDKTIKELENEKSKLFKYLQKEISEKQKALSNEFQSLNDVKSKIATRKTEFEDIFYKNSNNDDNLQDYNTKSQQANKVFESFENICNEYKVNSKMNDSFAAFDGYSKFVQEQCEIVNNLCQKLSQLMTPTQKKQQEKGEVKASDDSKEEMRQIVPNLVTIDATKIKAKNNNNNIDNKMNVNGNENVRNDNGGNRSSNIILFDDILDDAIGIDPNDVGTNNSNNNNYSNNNNSNNSGNGVELRKMKIKCVMDVEGNSVKKTWTLAAKRDEIHYSSLVENAKKVGKQRKVPDWENKEYIFEVNGQQVSNENEFVQHCVNADNPDNSDYLTIYMTGKIQ